MLHFHQSATLAPMPTTRPRHMITESEQLAHALELAGERWPEIAEDKGKLIKKMLEFSAEALRKEQNSVMAQRLSKVEELAGSLEDVWPANWREEARAEWPA